MSETTVLNLSKGEKIDLSKTNPGVDAISLGLGWDENSGNGGKFDLDATAVLLDVNGKLLNNDPKNVIYFGNLTGTGVKHTGDNLTGQGDGDDETINVTLSAVPAECHKVAFLVNIYEASSRRQNFGMVKNAFIRAYNTATKVELESNGKRLHFDLSEDYGAFTGVVMGALYRREGEWKMEAIGEGRNGDLNTIIASL